MMDSAGTKRLSADDLLAGVLMELALRGYRTFSVRTDRFDAAMEASYRWLRQHEDDFGVRVQFRIVRDPLHGDSQTVRDAVAAAAQQDLISLDNPEYQDIRLKTRGREAEELLRRLPGGPNLYAEVAKVFMSGYRLESAAG